MSLLTNIGLPELVAATSEEYLAISLNLAGDLNRLQSLRRGLRDMMARSPLTDAGRFTDNIESCYRSIWQRWCNAG